MVSVKKVCRSLRVCSFHIIGRNHSNTLLLVNLQKTQNLSKVKHCSKGYLFWFQNFERFRQVFFLLLNVFFSCKTLEHPWFCALYFGKPWNFHDTNPEKVKQVKQTQCFYFVMWPRDDDVTSTCLIKVARVVSLKLVFTD